MNDLLSNSIEKYLAGTATPEEKILVEEYYESFSNEKDYTDSLTSAERTALEQKILTGINSSISQTPLQRHRPVVFWKYALPLAASLTALLVLAFIYRAFDGKTVRITTAYGEVKSHILPDNSEIVLNGNSVLEYDRFDDEGTRSVRFKGEGYFSIEHTESHQPFVVEVPGGFQIEVVGTVFNVSARESIARVVLSSGKVILNRISKNEPAIVMQPGDMVELRDSDRLVTRSVVDTERYSSWKDHRLVFDNTPLKEIVQMLQDTYGYQVTVENELLLQETFTGRIPGNEIDLLLRGLRKLDLRIDQNGKHIEIKNQR